MKRAILAAALLTATAAMAVPAKTPEETWKAELADANASMGKAHYSFLKIQDAAYLHDGETATLTGTKGQPFSYKWKPGTVSGGILTATVHGGHPSVTKDGKTYSEADLGKGLPVDTDVDVKGATTQVDANVWGARIMVFNQKAKTAMEFKGVDFYPYNPAFRIQATFKPDPALPPRVFITSRKTNKQFYHTGDASFTLMGKTFTLPFYADDKKKIDTMSAFFMDDLTGKETYGAGRYVDVGKFGAFPPKTITIDFNEAYNPNCARSAFFTCPVARDVLAMAVKAGERDPHKAH